MQYWSYKVFGLQRSGNHAVLNWIIGLDPDSFLFFNNVNVEKPLKEGVSPISLPEGARAYCFRHGGRVEYREEELQRFQEKGGILLTSYENYSPEYFFGEKIENNIYDEFGGYCGDKKIVILRNPYNMLASTERMILNKRKKYSPYRQYLRRLIKGKRNKDRPISTILHEKVEIWLNYARVCSSSSEYEDVMPVIFDRLVSDKGYRDRLAEDMGFHNNDCNLDFISDAGGGSSFNKSKDKGGRNPLERSSDASGDPVWRSVAFGNSELKVYTQELFGEDGIPSGM